MERSPRWARLLQAFFDEGYRRFNTNGVIPKTLFTGDVETYQAAEVLGTVGTFHGHDGLDRIIAELHDAFDEVRFAPRTLRVVQVEPLILIVTVRFQGVGRGSGITVDRDIAHVFTLRDGIRAERLEVYWEPSEALEAVGARE